MPSIQRDGDVWSMHWAEHDVALGLERPREIADGLRLWVTVESRVAGRVLGPVGLNVVSSESQVRFANACAKRVNGLSQEVWHAIVVHACAVVAKQYYEPAPTVVLSTVQDAGPVAYLLPGLVPHEETTVLYGDGEAAKSLLALRIALSVQTGAELPWGDQPAMAQVLYLDWETNERTVASRLRRLALGEALGVPPIRYRQCFRSLPDELPSVRAEISREQIGLVVVDSIGFAASGALVEDETARTAMNALRQMAPATRLVVAHVSKSSAESSGPVKPFGSAFFWNGMRSGIEVRRSEDQPSDDSLAVGLYHRKANDGEHHKPIGLRVLFDGTGGAISIDQTDINEVADLAARTSLSARLRALLRRGERDVADLAEEVDASPDTVRSALRRMSDAIPLGERGGRGKVGTWGLRGTD